MDKSSAQSINRVSASKFKMTVHPAPHSDADSDSDPVATGSNSSANKPKLTLNHILPFLGTQASNEEKIAALSVVPQLVSHSDSDPATQLPILNQALDHAYVRKLLKAKSTQFQAIALHILAVLCSNAEVAQSPSTQEYLIPLSQLLSSAEAAISEAALEVLLRLGSHDNQQTAIALLSNPGPWVDILLSSSTCGGDRQSMLSAFLIHLAHTAGSRIHASLPLLNQLRTRLLSSSTSPTSPPEQSSSARSASNLTLLTLLTSILESLPPSPTTNQHDHSILLTNSLPLAPLITSLLRTRGTPQPLIRATLRLASAYLAHAPLALSTDPTSWIVTLTAAAVEFCMLLDDALPDPTAAVSEINPDMESAVGACCSVLEHQVSGLLSDHPAGSVGASEKCWQAWRRHAANVLLAAGAYLSPVSSAVVDRHQEGASADGVLANEVVLAVARLVCRILAEADEDHVFDQEASAAGATASGSQSFDVGGDSGPEAGIGAVIFPIAVKLVSDTHVPVAVLPWAAAYLARASAEEQEGDVAQIIQGVSRRLAEYIKDKATVDLDVVTNLASVLLNLVMLREAGDDNGKAIEAMAASVQLLASVLDSGSLVDSLFVQHMLGKASRDTSTAAHALAAGQALGTLAGYLSMTLRTLISSSPDPTRPAFHLVPQPTLRRILQLAPVFVNACWRRNDEDLSDLVHLVLDPLAAVCYSASSPAGRMWRDADEVKRRKQLLRGVKVPKDAADEALFLGL
ncbi:hypothetical protein BCR44DRAFT_1427435 [Catenaria anguillulae PL171]|uniref:Neurochondrin-domain-containing protein n=1 Tax=Catenaria anguillulae PL171 TaxID=765915 RepID=A0A1Y2HXG8_9FUNG|nr:hypothetical protein BCR44DRAFT_1427435 [Catenaria anguillulae PL171]